MVLVAIGLAVVLLPVWLVLIALKLMGLAHVCSWKILLIPVWLVLVVGVGYFLLAIGFVALIFLIQAVLG